MICLFCQASPSAIYEHHSLDINSKLIPVSPRSSKGSANTSSSSHRSEEQRKNSNSFQNGSFGEKSGYPEEKLQRAGQGEKLSAPGTWESTQPGTDRARHSSTTGAQRKDSSSGEVTRYFSNLIFVHYTLVFLNQF